MLKRRAASTTKKNRLVFRAKDSHDSFHDSFHESHESTRFHGRMNAATGMKGCFHERVKAQGVMNSAIHESVNSAIAM